MASASVASVSGLSFVIVKIVDLVFANSPSAP